MEPAGGAGGVVPGDPGAGAINDLRFRHLAHQEDFEWRILAGGLLAVAGIAVIFRDQISADVQPFSLLAIVFAAVCIAEASVLYKKFPGMHPVTTIMV